ncbi:MAG: MFS transporter [Oligosphaeraceae bacterium]
MSTPKKEPKLYHCGKLTYTLPQLYLLFFWLMLGVACIGLANTLPGAILPIQIKELNISDTASWLILSCIGAVLNMTVCPYISVASDLYRSKWGRRIPFIALSTPPVVLALCLFAFTHRFGHALSAWVQPFWQTTPATMIAVVIGMVTLLFQFFMMWVNSVIWYIFIDIIPPQFFGRVMACVRLALQFSAAFFHYFLFPIAQKHASLIFLSVALLYGAGILLFCLNVKEGEYPPLTEEQLKRKQAKGLDQLKAKVSGFREFLTYTFCHRIYVMRYFIHLVGSISGGAGVFAYFLMSKQLELTDTDIGHMNGISGMVCSAGILLATLLPVLVNRWHPMRIINYNTIFNCIIALPFYFRWVLGTMPPQVYVNLVIINSIINLFLTGLITVSEQPLEMMLFPKSRYGTFCAMQAMLRSWAGLLAGLLVARIFDYVAQHFTTCSLALKYGAGWHYRLSTPWSLPWILIMAYLSYLFYRQWAKLGGYHSYAAPAPWVPEGKEAVEQLPCQPVTSRQMRISLYFFDAFFLFFAILTPIVAFWQGKWRCHTPLVQALEPATHTLANQIRDFFCSGGDPTLFRNYLILPTILTTAALLLWIPLRMRIAQRARTARNGTGLFQPTLLMILLGLHGLDLLNDLWGILHTPGAYGAHLMVLSSASVFLGVFTIAIIHRMERGISVVAEQ